jgi:hypothetical protein
MAINPRPYFVVSGFVFALVALLHLTRAIYGWPVLVAGQDVPLAVSWAGFILAASLALWAVQLAGRSKSDSKD